MHYDLIAPDECAEALIHIENHAKDLFGEGTLRVIKHYGEAFQETQNETQKALRDRFFEIDRACARRQKCINAFIELSLTYAEQDEIRTLKEIRNLLAPDPEQLKIGYFPAPKHAKDAFERNLTRYEAFLRQYTVFCERTLYDLFVDYKELLLKKWEILENLEKSSFRSLEKYMLTYYKASDLLNRLYESACDMLKIQVIDAQRFGLIFSVAENCQIARDQEQRRQK